MYNFDEVVNRVGTNSAKWDGWKMMDRPQDVTPLWVADMDFKSPPEVIEALQKRVAHGVFGYTIKSDSYLQSVIDWMKKRHHWDIEADWVVPLSGVVPAIKVAVNAYTKPGDAIIIQKPVYYPFDASITLNRRKIVENAVIRKGDQFEIDFQDFEQKIIDNNVKMYILCNPFNPIGKVWTKEELQKAGDICKKHNVFVVSDEIHNDFVYGDNVHVPFTEVDASFKEFSIICTAPSKTFNLAGLQICNIIIPNEKHREVFKNQVARSGASEPGPLGYVACQAAYEKGATWCDEMLVYLQENIDCMDAFFKEYLPQIKMIRPQGLYLVWVDFTALELDHIELEKFMLEKAKLWLDEGYIFGMQGAGYERFNVAMPRSELLKTLKQLEKAIKETLK